jgi:hypothetical protein
MQMGPIDRKRSDRTIWEEKNNYRSATSRSDILLGTVCRTGRRECRQRSALNLLTMFSGLQPTGFRARQNCGRVTSGGLSAFAHERRRLGDES